MSKNTIKKILAAVLAACMTASLAACAGKEKTPEEKFSDAVSSTYGALNDLASEYAASSYDYGSSSVSDKSSSEPSSAKTEIDPFKNLKITYTGSSPYIKAATDSSQCDSTVNKYIEFKTEDKCLRNGDEFTVTAVYNEDTLNSNGYVVTSDTKTYTVEKQPEYITSVEGLDLKALQSEIDDKLTTVTAANKNDSEFADVNIVANAWYLSGGRFDSIASKKLKSIYLISLKPAFADKFGGDYSNLKYYNRYMQLYEYTINRTKLKGENVDKTKVYVIVYADDLNKDTDGTVNWILELGSKGYKDYNSLVNDYVTTKKQYYNVTQIK